MLVKIANQARDYAWGSTTLIPDYFGIKATGQPMAEIWFGTHPGSASVLSEDPTTTLSQLLDGKHLPFLLKILAAESPLSIQAHPNSNQAKAGFEFENSAGIPISAQNRNYKDDRHKPEIIVALSRFEALCGFKPINKIDEMLEDLETHLSVSEGFRTITASWRKLLNTPDGLQKVFADISSHRGNLDGYNAELASMAQFEARFELAERLNTLYPGDPGVVLAMLMNHMVLEPGEALFLPAGNIHAYLHGLGVELMAASDNVLRGGLTSKHIDVEQLKSVVDFAAKVPPKVVSIELAAGLVRYPCEVDDFQLYRAEPSGAQMLIDIQLPGDSILLCTAGEVTVSNSQDERLVLARGEAAFMSADAKFFSLTGAGTAYLATSGSD